MSEWQPGDVALCVDDRGADKDWPSPLRAGDSYTVIGTTLNTGMSPYDPEGVIRLCLLFLEIKNPEHHRGGFDARRFIKQPSLVIESEEKQEEPVE